MHQLEQNNYSGHVAYVVPSNSHTPELYVSATVLLKTVHLPPRPERAGSLPYHMSSQPELTCYTVPVLRICAINSQRFFLAEISVRSPRKLFIFIM